MGTSTYIPASSCIELARGWRRQASIIRAMALKLGTKVPRDFADRAGIFESCAIQLESLTQQSTGCG